MNLPLHTPLQIGVHVCHHIFFNKIPSYSFINSRINVIFDFEVYRQVYSMALGVLKGEGIDEWMHSVGRIFLQKHLLHESSFVIHFLVEIVR